MSLYVRFISVIRYERISACIARETRTLPVYTHVRLQHLLRAKRLATDVTSERILLLVEIPHVSFEISRTGEQFPTTIALELQEISVSTLTMHLLHVNINTVLIHKRISAFRTGEVSIGTVGTPVVYQVILGLIRFLTYLAMELGRRWLWWLFRDAFVYVLSVLM